MEAGRAPAAPALHRAAVSPRKPVLWRVASAMPIFPAMDTDKSAHDAAAARRESIAAIEGIEGNDAILTRRAIALLTPEECARARNDIFALREHWTSWMPGLPFYTLGAASYKDAPTNGRPAYYEKAAKLNPILHERFGWLHEKLRARLEEELGAPVFFDPALGLPGFHVFLYHPAFTKPLASIHFDLQHKDLDWSAYEKVDKDAQLSLTLSFKLPRCGAGLRLWNVTFAQAKRMTKAELFTATSHEPELHTYTEGHLVLHSGYQLHQIAPAPGMAEDDERITLQAHALPTERGYVLYW
jgi:hypothetical protein